MLKALELWSQITGVQVAPSSKLAISLRMYVFWLPHLWSQDGSLLLSSFRVPGMAPSVFCVLPPRLGRLSSWLSTGPDGLSHLPKVTQLANEVALASDLLNFTVLT